MPEDVPHPEPSQIELERVLGALSDPVRLAIVRLAARGEPLPCGAFFERIPKSTLSHHWKVLRESGLIRQTKQGTSRLNALRKSELDARFPGLLDAVLAAATVTPDAGP